MSSHPSYPLIPSFLRYLLCQPSISAKFSAPCHPPIRPRHLSTTPAPHLFLSLYPMPSLNPSPISKPFFSLSALYPVNLPHLLICPFHVIPSNHPSLMSTVYLFSCFLPKVFLLVNHHFLPDSTNCSSLASCRCYNYSKLSHVWSSPCCH